MGIGTLQEKSPHAFIKNYIKPDKQYHEVSYAGYVADIKVGNNIVEIQSKDFGRLRDKIKTYLELGNNVTVVFPVITDRYIIWLNPDTNEIVEKRKSYKNMTEHNIFKELYKIRELLNCDNLTFRLIGLSVDDYRYLDGYGKNFKNKATKIDKIPKSVTKDIVLGFDLMIPNTLGKTFGSKEFSKEAKCNIDIARVSLLILTELGYLRRVGKSGKSYIYERA